MGTATPGGSYAVYGPAWGNCIGRATGLAVAYRATQGPNENIILLDRGAIDLGMTSLGVARQAWEGTGDWTGGAMLRGMRALFPMYGTPFHGIALARSGIAGLDALHGRVIGVGPEDGTSGTYMPHLLRALGILDVTLRHGTMRAQAADLLEGRIDACLLAAGAPIPAIAAAEARAPLTFFGIPPAAAPALRGLLPELTPTLVPAGTYRGMPRDLATIGMFNFALARRDLPDDLAHAAVRAALEPGALVEAGPLATGTLLANVDRDRFLPFHPGAARYYAERGQPIPDALVVS